MRQVSTIPRDTQVTINLGNCPHGTLVHRTSLTQSLTCVGSWQSEGVMFLVSLSDVWEYWEPGEYKNSDKSFSCMAFTTDGLKIYMAQVILSKKIDVCQTLFFPFVGTPKKFLGG